MGAIFDKRLKQAKLETSNGISMIEHSAIKNETKTKKLQTFDLSDFLG